MFLSSQPAPDYPRLNFQIGADQYWAPDQAQEDSGEDQYWPPVWIQEYSVPLQELLPGWQDRDSVQPPGANVIKILW